MLSEPPQTVAIEDEPLLSVMSLRTRIVYGNSSARRQHRVKRAPGELAVPGVAARRGAEAADFTDRIRREVIVDHEARVAEALEPVDHLLAVLGAQGRGADRLGLAAGEQSRTVGAGQEADHRLDRANGLGVAAVDAAAVLEDGAANDLGLELLHQLQGAEVGGRIRRFEIGERFARLLASGVDRGLPLLLVGQLVGSVEVLADDALELGLGVGLVFEGVELPRILGGLFGELDDPFAHLPGGGVGEHHCAEHDVFRQLLGFGFDHHHGVERPGNDQVELALFDLGLGRVEDIFAVLEADAGAADRTHERNTRETQRCGRGAHGDDVGLVLTVVGQHLGDDENLVVETLGEQRPEGAVDQAAGQRFLFGRAALALEEAAGDAAGSGEFFLVVDGQREEVLSRLDVLGGSDRAQDDGFAEGRENRAVGLAGDAARFELEGLAAKIDFYSLDVEHLVSFTRRPNARPGQLFAN